MQTRLVLGTAQLGMPYGINNHHGQPDVIQATAIVGAAHQLGIRTFDTAQSYGNSQQVLGEAFERLKINSDVAVYSKLAANLNYGDKKELSDALTSSLLQLRLKAFAGLMLHDEKLLDQWQSAGLKDTLQGFVQDGRIKSIGVSVYHPQRAIQALHSEGVDFVQVPSNILDHRFEEAGVFELAQQLKKTIFIRSVFLQGLLLMDHKDIPEQLSHGKPIFEKLNHLALKFNVALPALVMGYVSSKWPMANIIFGAETVAQVKSNVALAGVKLDALQLKEIDVNFKNVSEEILNPALWVK